MGTHIWRLVAALAVLCCIASSSEAQTRLPPIPADKMTEAQKKAAADFAAGRSDALDGPWMTFLRSPELMERTMGLSDYVRRKSVIEPRVSELVILVVAREWTQQFEWTIHYKNALQAGLKPAIADTIAEGRRPEAMAEDEAIAYDVATEILRTKGVSDTTWSRAVAKFGEQGVVDLLATVGYFNYLSVVMNAARTPAPSGSVEPLKRLPE
jgi:4-carboxymuconolactone decarboxylase